MTGSVTPSQGLNTIVNVAGQPCMAIPPFANGGLIVNPLDPTDQGQSGDAQVLYVDCVNGCEECVANDTVVALQPGDSWPIIPGQTTPTYVNSKAQGHKFTAIQW